MNNDNMNQDLVDEIDYLIDLLTKSGFFSTDEILEILEDQFFEEEIDFSNFNISQNTFSNDNFSRLEKVFNNLTFEGIICIHNCGYDVQEGVNDAFEVHIHLTNNGFSPKGFCFYTFEDIEEAIFDSKLKITFGDYDNDKNKALSVGKTIFKYLKNENFNIDWDETINTQIEINPFIWDKSYNSQKEYEIEGAYETFKKIGV